MKVTGFHHVALTVRNLDSSAAWYEQLLDLELMLDESAEERQAKVYRLRDTDVLLGLVEHAGNVGSAFEPTRTGLDHVAFSVTSRADIDGWVTRLDDLGIQHSGVIDIPMGAILNLHDPDGIALSLFWTRE